MCDISSEIYIRRRSHSGLVGDWGEGREGIRSFYICMRMCKFLEEVKSIESHMRGV